MPRIKLIIFDLDGTLVDSQDAIARGINFALTRVGLEPKPGAEISSYIGTGVDDLIRKSLGQKAQGFFEKTKTIFEDYRINFPDTSSLYPRVKETLEFFKEKKKAVVTNRKYEFAAVTLKKLGIFDCFEKVLGGDDARCMKPSACLVNELIFQLKIAKNKTIMVGDMDVDILAGKAAGITTCAVTYGIGRREDILKAKPDYIIDNLAELKDIIT
ncbi:MAG: HAD-IA family hydrolase [Candidatus Omnitrophota bacterium]